MFFQQHKQPNSNNAEHIPLSMEMFVYVDV